MRQKEQMKRFSVRFPLDLLETVKQAAKEDERPINSEIIWLLKIGLTLRRAERKPQGK